MTTTDTDALAERIARTIYGRQEYSGLHGDFENAPEWLRESMRIDAAAVLPIVAEEVRKAKAEAWDEGHNTRRTVERGGWYLNPYREAGDSDEYR